MNTNIKNNKMGLGLRGFGSAEKYMIKYDTQSESPLRVQKTDVNGNKEIFEFKTIRDTALFLKNDGIFLDNDFKTEECSQMLVNAFNNKGTIL